MQNNIELEKQLLLFWKKGEVEWLYKYKHRVYEYRGLNSSNSERNLSPIELFYDFTNGSLFKDIDDFANCSPSEDIIVSDIIIHIDDLLKNRNL